MVVRGSIYLLIYHAYSVLARADEAEIGEVEEIFREGLLKVLLVMEARIREVLSTLPAFSEVVEK